HHACLMKLRDTRIGGDRGHLRIQRYQRDLRHGNIVLPRHVDLFLQRKETRRCVIDRERTAAVDRHIEGAVAAADRLAEFRMIEDGHRYTRNYIAVAAGDFAPENSGSSCLDGPGCDSGLNRINSRIKKLRGLAYEGDRGASERRRIQRSIAGEYVDGDAPSRLSTS